MRVAWGLLSLSLCGVLSWFLFQCVYSWGWGSVSSFPLLFPSFLVIVIAHTVCAELTHQHEELVSTLYQEEEEIIQQHKQQVDDVMSIIRMEMRLLNEAEQPGANIDQYVKELDELLQAKQQVIQDLRNRLGVFRQRLQEEETLSKSMPKSPKY